MQSSGEASRRARLMIEVTDGEDRVRVEGSRIGVRNRQGMNGWD
jgi:hypothetical protein